LRQTTQSIEPALNAIRRKLFVLTECASWFSFKLKLFYSGPVIKKISVSLTRQTNPNIENAKTVDKSKSIIVTGCASKFNISNN
jgi:hypothetical protein